MTICKFVNTSEGCKFGENCRFEHDSIPAGKSPDSNVDKNDKQHPQSHEPTTTPACRFFRRSNGCKFGDKCRFQHNEPGRPTSSNLYTRFSAYKDIPAKQKAGQEKETRILGGARVEFEDGASVQRIEISAAETAKIQLYHVTCTWIRARKTATIDLKNPHDLEMARRNLRKAKILDQRINYSLSVDRSKESKRNQIIIYDLDQWVSMRTVKEACGVRIEKAFFNDPHHNEDEERVLQEILDSARLSCQSWVKCDEIIEYKTKGNKVECSSNLILGSMADVKKVLELDKKPLSQPASSRPGLTHIYKAKITTLAAIVKLFDKDVKGIATLKGSGTGVGIKVYDPKGRFQAIHLFSHSLDDVARTKRKLTSLLNGHTVASGTEKIWHKKLLSETGTAFLELLMKDHSVFIMRHRSQQLLVYGAPKDVAVVESLLIGEVERLKADDHVIEIDANVSFAALHQVFRELSAELGPRTVRADLASSPRRIYVDGSDEQHDKAKRTLDEAFNGGPPIGEQEHRAEEGTDAATICPVCLMEFEDGDTYSPPCSHLYHRECFIDQCTNTQEEIIKCLQCEKAIPLSELTLVLNGPQMDSLLEGSFRKYAQTHPAICGYCPTPGCDEVFAKCAEKDDEATTFRCSSCLSTFCCHCGTPEHRGMMTCIQSLKANKGDEKFEAWKKKNKTKECPVCGIVISKKGGCQHVECGRCKAHLCWDCLMVGKTSDEVYRHLREEHDGYFDNTAVEQDRVAHAEAARRRARIGLVEAERFRLIAQARGFDALAREGGRHIEAVLARLGEDQDPVREVQRQAGDAQEQVPEAQQEDGEAQDQAQEARPRAARLLDQGAGLLEMGNRILAAELLGPAAELLENGRRRED